MGWFTRTRADRPARRGFLTRLAADVRGNTLAIMAAALIPLVGMVGGGIDISRMYMTKTRLQHACDAGALAGRKQMGGGVWGTDDDAVAKRFFDANFGTGAYGSTTLSRSFSENAGKVTGNASTNLPMTLTRVIGRTSELLTVTCDAEMKLPNTDVMFVLDTTGSMNCVAGDTSCPNGNNNGNPAPGSKIDGLKTAVKCFYEILAQLDTDANCTTGTPSGGTSSAVQIRFGFVPYSSNVNVGYLLPSSYFANKWSYQSRARDGNKSDWSDWQTTYTYTDQNGNCPSTAGDATHQYKDGTRFRYGYNYYCQYNYRYYGPRWVYKSTSVDLTGLKNGNGWNTSFQVPINDDASNRTITWDGCIEERTTVRAASYDPIPNTPGNKAYDLDINLKPDSNNADTLWAPALPQVIYYRSVLNDVSQASTDTATTANNFSNNASYSCPTQSKKLQSWPDATQFDNYVNSFVATGNTYHDIGMLWGARLMSPTGIFASENATAANGGQIQRHMIFMTDGDSSSTPCDYNAYGVPFYDQRQTTSVGAAKDCLANNQNLIDQINLRLEALCNAVKSMPGTTTLWVVSYGGGINSTTEDRLTKCASDPDSVATTHYFTADDPDKLQKTFNTIANAISQLRLTH